VQVLLSLVFVSVIFGWLLITRWGALGGCYFQETKQRLTWRRRTHLPKGTRLARPGVQVAVRVVWVALPASPVRRAVCYADDARAGLSDLVTEGARPASDRLARHPTGDHCLNNRLASIKRRLRLVLGGISVQTEGRPVSSA